ncbi:MAG: hypothetical protein Tsb0021_00300 [Chlamydiales bacterium]
MSPIVISSHQDKLNVLKFDKFPIEIHLKIFSYLNRKNLPSVALANKAWHKLTCEKKLKLILNSKARFKIIFDACQGVELNILSQLELLLRRLEKLDIRESESKIKSEINIIFTELFKLKNVFSYKQKIEFYKKLEKKIIPYDAKSKHMQKFSLDLLSGIATNYLEPRLLKVHRFFIQAKGIDKSFSIMENFIGHNNEGVLFQSFYYALKQKGQDSDKLMIEKTLKAVSEKKLEYAHALKNSVYGTYRDCFLEKLALEYLKNGKSEEASRTLKEVSPERHDKVFNEYIQLLENSGPTTQKAGRSLVSKLKSMLKKK